MRLGCFLLAILFFISPATYAQIYKYQDAQGNWHFTDKKPDATKKAEVISVKTNTQDNTQTRKPDLEREIEDSSIVFYLANPFPAPLHCYAKHINSENYNVVLLSANERAIMFRTKQMHTFQSDLEYGCLLGDPESTPSNLVIGVPFTGYKSMRISQGFGGPFSHGSEPVFNSIDIAMPVGTQITAALPGTVIDIQDRFTYAGANSTYFYDKANHVMILHEDGSYATYAHLLAGKVIVGLGDEVKQGDVIGYSGNTGFSTGPHLHFVIQHNKQGFLHSLPFKIEQSDGSVVTPEFDMWLLPSE